MYIYFCFNLFFTIKDFEMTKFMRFFSLALISIIVFTSNTFAVDKIYELTFKTSINNTAGKERVETVINLLKGVKETNLNLENRTLTVEYDPDHINSDMIAYCLKSLGYDVVLVNDSEVEAGK